MDIIQRGQHPNQKVYRGTCSACKTILQAVRGELKIENCNDPREPGEWASAACPVCGESVCFYPLK